MAAFPSTPYDSQNLSKVGRGFGGSDDLSIAINAGAAGNSPKLLLKDSTECILGGGCFRMDASPERAQGVQSIVKNDVFFNVICGGYKELFDP